MEKSNGRAVALILLLLGTAGYRAYEHREAILDWMIDRAVTPVGPGELAKLVPEGAHGQVGAFFRDLATVVEKADGIKTTDQLRSGAEIAREIFTDSIGFTSNMPEFDKEISERFKKVLGLGSESLTADKRAAYAKVAREIAYEVAGE